MTSVQRQTAEAVDGSSPAVTATEQNIPTLENITADEKARTPVAEDVQTAIFKFAKEEPLGLTAEQGFGYLQVDFGDTLGPAQRYKIVRKLGFGMNSSVWLVRDTQDNRYVAMKALTGYATALLSDGYMQELRVLQRISPSNPFSTPPTHCLALLSHFIHPGKDQDGNHLCIITDVLGGSVAFLLHASKTGALPVPLAKRVLRDTLLGLAHMHKHGVIHTDLKADNIMMDLEQQDLEPYLENDPPRRYPPEPTWGNKTVKVAVSQPLPYTDPLSRSFLIIDFGSAQLHDEQVVDEITPSILRAPETILKGPWNEKVDIWTYGCLVYEFLIGSTPFKHENEQNLRPEVTHLFQMMSVTGERFMPSAEQHSSSLIPRLVF